ncbi:MAG: hypothetical protein AB7Y46_03415 [Armatimonadota bacterium]
MDALTASLAFLGRRPLAVTALIVVIYLVVLVPRLSHESMDGYDMPVILDALIADHSLQALGSWFVGPWARSPDYYRPLVSLLDWVDFHVWGLAGWGWRLTNALLIAATMLALALLCRDGLELPSAGPVAAALLPLYDVAGGATFWPAWRTDVLCGLFLCLATGAALGYLREGRRRRAWLALGAFLLAMLSKEAAFIWPAFLAVSVLILGNHRRGLLLLVAVTGLGGAVWLLRIHFLGHPLLGAPILHLNLPLERQLWHFWHVLFGPLYYGISLVIPTMVGEPFWWLSNKFLGVLLSGIVFIVVNVAAGVGAPRLLGVLWAWRLIMYLPSMPFARIYLFYIYIPTLGTVLLYGVGIVCAARLVYRCYAHRQEVEPHAMEAPPDER